jgi:hypothetical protein
MRARVICLMVTVLAMLASGSAHAGGFVGTGVMTRPRAGHQAVLLNDGRVLIVSGGSPYGPYYPDASAELYDPSTGTFAAAGSMNIPRVGSTAVLLQSGKVLVYGGGENCYYCQAEIYDPATSAWTLTGADPYRLDAMHQTGTLLEDGAVLATGGWDSQDVGVSDLVLLYDPSADQFSNVGILTAQRYSSTATLLSNGKVLIAGGDNWSDGYGAPLPNADLYDPHSKTVSPVGPMTTPRAFHSATLLNNGKVFVAGGTIEISEGDDLAHGTTEIFDPSTNTFSGAGVMTDARTYHTATLLPDGEVLIAGGANTKIYNPNPPGDAIPYAELYNPVARTFTRIASMIQARQSHQAVLLPNGNALITGGYDNNGNRLATAELYVAHPTARPLPPSLSPSSLNFGTVAVSLTTPPMSVVIKNPRRDRQPLFIEGQTTTTGYAIMKGCVQSLQPGQQCEVTLTFSPPGLGAQNGQLTIFDNGPNGEQSVALSGSGK